MQKVMIIGKLNEILEDMYTGLSQEYQVQLVLDSFDDAEKLEKVMGLVKPDIVIMSLVGIFEPLTTVYAMYKREFVNTSIITVGTAREYTKQSKFCDTKQFEFMERPVTVDKISEMCKSKLSSVSRGGGTRRKVLIIDDDPVMLRTTKAMLDNLYDVSIAPSGQKGLAMIDSKTPDVILLDYEMPQMDGRDVLEIIRNSGSYSKIPVIFLTGISDREHIKAIISLRPNAYLLKPPVKENLVATISKQFD